MYVLGIVGGVGSGKSAVANALALRGAAVLDADQVGHEVLRDQEVVAAFRQRWGDAVVAPDGQINRPEVARRVFGADEVATREREFLNSISHPRIGDLLRRRIEASRQERKTSLVAIDAALLYESGWDQFCHGVVFVDAPQTVRRQRALSRGWTAEQFAAREASQWPVEEKKSRASWIVDNSGALAELSQQVDEVMRKIGVAPR